MLSYLLIAALSAAPHVAGPSLNLGGGAPVAKTAPARIVDWRKAGGLPRGTLALSCWPDSVLGLFNCQYGKTKTNPANAGTPVFASEGTFPWWPSVAWADGTDWADFGDLDAVNGSFTFFAVFKPNAVNVAQTIFSKDAAANNRSFNIALTSAGAPAVEIWKGDSSRSISTGAGTALAGKWNRIAISYNAAPGDGSAILKIRLNRTNSTDAANFVAPPQQTSSKLQIGHRDYAASQQPFNGEFGGLQLWAGFAASTDQLTAASDGFGVGATTVALGDSITVGNSSPYPTQLNTALGFQWIVTNAGNSGDTVPMMATRWNASYAGGGYKWLTFLGGTNDLLTRTAVAIYADWLAIVNDAKARGMKVIAYTVPPRNLEAGPEAERLALNALIATTEGVNVYDLSGAVSNPGDLDSLSATYDQGDHVHLNAAGHTLMSNYAAGIIAP